MPVLEQVSADYDGQVTFLAIAARGDADVTAQRANDWLPSGRVKWAFDPSEDVWRFFGVRGTPTTLLLSADDRVLGGWPGEVGEENLRSALDELVSRGS